MKNMVFKFFTFAILLLCLPSLAYAQERCCCCNARISGDAYFKEKKYQTAYDIWLSGRRKCPDALRCPELVDKIKIVKKKLDIFEEGFVKTVKVPLKGKKKFVKEMDKFENQEIAKRTFKMGDQFEEGDYDENSHNVTVGRFWISPTEVTFEEYDTFCDATAGKVKPSDNGWGRDQLPVINIDWYDAIEYCNWRSKKDSLQPVYEIKKLTKDPNNQDPADLKKWTIICKWSNTGYRLPTEAEWEYSARSGGKDNRYGNGKDIADPAEINFDASQENKNSLKGLYRQKTVGVENLSSNEFQYKNMSGNVSEWCWDWYNERFYSDGEGKNPKGSIKGANRVCRGGSWRDNPRKCRVSYRRVLQPIYSGNDVGFRLVKKE